MDGPDELRPAAAVVQGRAQVAGGAGQAGLGDVGVRPDERLELALGDGVGATAHEVAQQLECLGGEGDGFPAAQQLARVLVEDEIAEPSGHRRDLGLRS